MPFDDANGAIGAEKSTTKPNDKWRMVQIVFFMHGISALLPWNMLINADSYFVDYKLNPDGALSGHSSIPLNCSLYTTSLNSTECNVNNQTISSNQTSFGQSSSALANYRQNFLPYLSTASKLPNIIFQLINLLFSSSYKASSNRLVISFVVEIFLFLITILLAFIDSSSWPELFFWVTIAIAVLFNTVNGIFQSCIYGIGAKFPMQYTNYITLGFSFSGTIASIFLIISLLLSPHPKVVAIYYFAFATVFMLACLINEFIVRKNDFLNYNVLENETSKEQHSLESKSTTTRTISSFQNPFSVSESDLVNSNSSLECTVAYEENPSNRKIYLFIFQKSWAQLVNIVVIYFVSFAIFPAVQAGIRPLNSIVGNKFFTPIFCFLFFNTFATVGNYVAERILLPTPKNLTIWVWLRFLFIPFFLLCNYLPSQRTWPVYFDNDVIYAIGSSLMAFTSGYLSALGMMYVPRCVPSNYASTAAMMASASVIIGILAGVQFSIVLRHMVTA